MKKTKGERYLNWFLLFIFLSMVVSLVQNFTRLTSAASAHAASSAKLMILETIAGMVILFIPKLVARIFHFYLPPILYFLFLLFIYGAVYLGTIYHFYSLVPYWDKGLHLVSGAMLGGFAFSLYGALTDKQTQDHPQIGFLCLYMLAFAVFCGVLWEFYEFTCDGIANMNLQRYLASSGRAFVGRAALMDTMGDLISDFFGGLILAVYSFNKMKNNPQWVKRFFFKKI